MNQPKPDTRHTFTLKRLLLAVLLFGVFCGLARLASADGIRIAALPAIISLAFAAGVLTHRYIVSLAVTLVLAMASFVTTSMIWDGGFPFAELRITVVDDRGKALDDVKMSVTSHRRGHPAVGYPIAEYEGVPLITDSNGVITCHQTRSGLQFGGHAWFLFWCIPVGTQSPQFDVHFDHPVQGRKTVSIWQLFYTDVKAYGDLPKTTFVLDGRPEEMPVYERQIVLTRP